MPYQLLYLHGDPESTKIHLQLDKTVKFNGILIPNVYTARHIAVGYAYAMYDFPEVFINPVKEKGKITGSGYFAILDIVKNRIIAVVVEAKK